MRVVATLLVLVGCAKAGLPGNNAGDDSGTGSGSGTDASNPPDDAAVDARPIDAPIMIDAPVMATFTETNASNVVTNNSFACSNTSTHYTRTNSYYRIYTLTDFGISTKFYVNQVSFAVEQATAGGGQTQQAAQIKVGTYDVAPVGTTLDLTKITPINAVNIQIPNGSSTLVNTPITATIPAGTNLIVELAIPDGNAVGNIFFFGTNGGGETKPGYIRAPDCNVTSPTTMLSVAQGGGLAEADLIMTVSGTH